MSAPPVYIRGSHLLGHPAGPGSGPIPPEGRAFPLKGRVPARTGLAILGNPFERKRNTVNVTCLYFVIQVARREP